MFDIGVGWLFLGFAVAVAVLLVLLVWVCYLVIFINSVGVVRWV